MIGQRTKPINKKRLFIRVYVSLMAVILAASLMALISQSMEARAQENPYSITQTAAMPEETQLERENISATGDAQNKRVIRADSVLIHYRGQTTKTTAGDETAGELLQRLGLEVSGEDVVRPGLDEKVFDGMEIFVDRIVTREETCAVTLPHEVSRCTDTTLSPGTQQVLLEGSDGELLRTERVTYKNGIEFSREPIRETVTRQPVREIIGIAPDRDPEETSSLEIGDGYIRLPTGETLAYTHTAAIRATGYTQTDPGCDGLTATGTNVRRGIVAVDPRYIPYGTRMFIQNLSGSYIYGIAVAEDCGGDIKGDRMDLYFPTYEEAREFGRRVCTVYFLG